MIKAVLIGVSLLLGCLTTIFFTRYLDYKITAKQLKKLNDSSLANYTQLYQNGSLSNTNYNESHPVIKSLTKLIQIPIIGQFFMDEKVYELAKIQHWQAIVNEIDHIVQTSSNKYNFAVWYHKALAQCSLGLVDQCQQSTKTMEMIAGNKYQRRISAWLYEQVKDLRQGKGKKKFDKLFEL